MEVEFSKANRSPLPISTSFVRIIDVILRVFSLSGSFGRILVYGSGRNKTVVELLSFCEVFVTV